MSDPTDQEPDHDVYPFESGFEFFTAGLVVGYIEGEKFDGEYDGEGDYYEVTRLTPVAGNNPEHEACINLIEKLIELEHKARETEVEEGDSEDDASEDTEEEEKSEKPVVTWDDIVAYADKGVVILYGEWNDKGKFDLPQYFSSIETVVADRLEEFEDDLTQPPTTGRDRSVSF